jgi:hypothetical protein
VQLQDTGIAWIDTETGSSLVMPKLHTYWLATNITRQVDAAFRRLSARDRQIFNNSVVDFVAAFEDADKHGVLIALGLLKPSPFPAIDPGPPPDGQAIAAEPPPPWREPPPRPSVAPFTRAEINAARLLQLIFAAVSCRETAALPTSATSGTTPSPLFVSSPYDSRGESEAFPTSCPTPTTPQPEPTGGAPGAARPEVYS